MPLPSVKLFKWESIYENVTSLVIPGAGPQREHESQGDVKAHHN